MIDPGWLARRGAIVADRTEGQFPVGVLAPESRVLDLYCAGFHGKNTASFCADAGVAEYEGVDCDVDKLALMRAIYPSAWRFVESDVAAAVAAHLEKGDAFDVVIADPWTQAIAATWEHLEEFERLLAPRGFLLLGCTNAERGAHPELKFHRRSNHAGGIWWAIVRKAFA